MFIRQFSVISGKISIYYLLVSFITIIGDALLYEINLFLFWKYGFYPVEVVSLARNSVTVTDGWEKSNPSKRLESIGFDG